MCDVHSIKIDRILERLKDGEVNFEELNKEIKVMHLEIQQLVESWRQVKIRNGGGREVIFRHEEWNQMIYDNFSPSKWRKKLVEVVRDVVLIVSAFSGMIYFIKTILEK